MNSNLSLTDDLWQGTLRLFQEVIFHLQFPVFPLDLAQPCAVAYGKRRFFASVLTAIYANPVTEGAFVNPEVGIAVVIGVLVDTLLVRTILVPASFLLIGERVWWPSRDPQPAPATPAVAETT